MTHRIWTEQEYEEAYVREGRDPEVHVSPINDTFEHVLEGHDCWCGPEVAEDGVVIHNSADGRDDYEEGKRKVH